MSPARPLLIVAALAVILSIVYIFAQVDPGTNGGIWAVWDEHRTKQGEGSKGPQQLTDGFPSRRSQISFLLLAFYFSLLSATRIGWHELNVGTWITRIQPREYTLRATGWVRVVSGVQSLISVYLVALAILTYFGTPFANTNPRSGSVFWLRVMKPIEQVIEVIDVKRIDMKDRAVVRR
jgi:hypothetical protein